MQMRTASYPGRAPETGSGAGPVRVLLVDDSPVFLKALLRFLADWTGTHVLDMVISGEHAVERVRELRPDLVLMDISMPGMGGLEATRQIKLEPRAPRVVVLSLDDHRQYRDAAQGVGGDGFVSKCEISEQLMPAIENLFPDRVRAAA